MKIIALLILIILFFPFISNAQNKTIQYEYDNLNRLARVDHSDGTVIEYTYDAVGNRVTHIIHVPTIVAIVTIPPGNPSPIPAENTQVTLDFDSGPGGEVTVTEIKNYPPPPQTSLANNNLLRFKKKEIFNVQSKIQLQKNQNLLTSAADNDAHSNFKKRGQKSSDIFYTENSEDDSLITAKRYWEITTDMATGSYTTILKIAYDVNDFPPDLSEDEANILYYDPNLNEYVALATLRDTANDTLWTENYLDNLGRFALGVTGQASKVTAKVNCPDTCVQNCPVTTPVIIDVSETSPEQLLGSYHATLTWDPTLLAYTGYSGGGPPFNNPIVNENNTAAGELNFEQSDATGAGGEVIVIQVNFNIIGDPGSSGVLDLSFSEIVAAVTFNNLLPITTIADCSFAIEQGCLLGDVTGDGECTIFDALIIATYDVGLEIPPEYLDRINQGCGNVTGPVDGDAETTIFDALIVATSDVGLAVAPYVVCEPHCPDE